MAAGVLAAVTLAAASRAGAQWAPGGVSLGYGAYPLAPVLVVPPYALPYDLYPDPSRFTDELPSCYRFGRCTLRDVERFRDRPHRLERLAPAAPEGVPFAAPRRADIPPTPEEHIRPEYRGASLPRAEFSETGTPR
jgi:hypothetical protein